MYAGDLTITPNEFRINILSCDRSPGLNARKVWEVLFRNTGIKEAENYDSFLCDLRLFMQCFEKQTPFWWAYSLPSGWTETKMYFEPVREDSYRVEIIGDEIVITRPQADV